MGILKEFLGRHRIVRWIFRSLITVIVACVAAMLLLPTWRDYRAISNLGQGTAEQQNHAIQIAAHRVQNRPIMIKKLIAALDTPSEAKFLACCRILKHFKKFSPKSIPSQFLDRYRLTKLKRAMKRPDKPIPQELEKLTANTRVHYAYQFILSPKPNQYKAKALTLLASDPQPSVRCSAALLAGNLKNSDILKKLLADKNPEVQSAAVMTIASCSMKIFIPEISALLDKSVSSDNTYTTASRDLVASCAYALAAMNPEEAVSEKICSVILKCKDDKLFERLCITLPIIGNANTKNVVLELLAKAKNSAELPSPMLLIAGGEMKILQAGQSALELLKKANTQDDLTGMTQSHMIAAMIALEKLGNPCRKEIYEFIKKFWRPDRPLMLAPAARLLGKQAAIGPADDKPTKAACLSLLFQIATYAHETTDGKIETTPLASAAAATAAWLLKPSHVEYLVSEGSNPSSKEMEIKFTSAFLVRQSAINEQAQVGDYVAWDIGRTQTVDAYALGEWFLPLPDENHRELNSDARSTGAILLAVASRSADQRVNAEKRIARRIKRESNFFSKGSYFCAMLMLWPGRPNLQEQVREYVYIPDFPRRRVFTALTFAGDKMAMDYLLLNSNKKVDTVALELVVWAMDEVLAVTAPAFITPHPAAYSEVRQWQVKIMRSQWACNRDSMKYGMAMME